MDKTSGLEENTKNTLKYWYLLLLIKPAFYE